MSDRGDYRSIYCSFWDDPDVHALGHLEYRVLTTLKGTLPASGMGVVYLSQLAERCAAPVGDVEAALSALAAPLPGKSHGWIVRERNVAWIVNALRYEPTLSHANGKHRTYLSERLLAPLGKGRPIVDAFKRYYAEWFPDAVPGPLDTPTDGNRNPIDRVSDHSPSQSIPSLSTTTAGLGDAPVIVGQGSGVVGTVVGETMSAAVVLVSALNRGITERWGEQPNPIRYDAPTTLSFVEETDKAGVPVDFARKAVYTAVKRNTSLSRPPRAISYFTNHVIERWQAEQAKVTAASVPVEMLPDAPTKANPEDRAQALVAQIRGMIETKGPSRFIKRDRVQSLGTDVFAAYVQVGGPDRFFNVPADKLHFLVREFAQALRSTYAA